MTKLIKHSAAIQLSGSLTLAQRQTYNALLKNAFPWLERGEDHWVQVKDLERILHKHGSRNRAWLIDTAESLRDVAVRYNVLGKDRENSEAWEMNSGLLAEVGVKSNRELIKYSFPNTLVDLLSNPAMYAKINLDFQARFRGHYGLPLYEFYLDILGGKRNSVEYMFWIEDLRRLLCLEDKHVQFKHLSNKVIKPAHREICEHTDINVEIVEQLRENRNVVALKLQIERPGLSVIDPVSQGSAADGPVRKGLESYYPTGTVALILNRYATDYIQAQLDYVQRQKARQSIKKPAAYLRAALQTDYAGYRNHNPATTVDVGAGQKPARTVGPTQEEIQAYGRKESEKRWRAYCNEALESRFAAADEQEKAALRVRFEASDKYEENRLVLRSGPDSGIYRNIFNVWLLHELCPEPRFHDLEAYLAWEADQQPPSGGDDHE